MMLSQSQLKLHSSQQGFALPIALGLGMVMLLLGLTTLIMSKTAQTTAIQRNRMGSSLLITEGGVARTLAQLSQVDNAPLLTLNYDSINPDTGRTYLGPDGIPNSGDEEAVAVNEWSSFVDDAVLCGSTATPRSPNITYSGAIGPEGQYTLRAYRYNLSQRTGTFVVEGQQGESESLVAVTLALESELPDFPGVLVAESGIWRGRKIFGANGNVYYNPSHSGNTSLTSGYAAPGDATRSNYLDALWSGPADLAGPDLIAGKIVACPLSFSWPHTPPSTTVEDLGVLNGDRALSGVNGSIKVYKASALNLSDFDVVTVDTTNGPVYLYLTNGPFNMRGHSQITNVRTDGRLPQVGDLRIIVATEAPLNLFDRACIQTAFIYNPTSDLSLQTVGDGCPSAPDTNIDGVVWVEDIVNSLNSSGGRATSEDNDLTVTTAGLVTTFTGVTSIGATAGVAVPDDVSSLSDVLASLNLPVTYKFGGVQTWQRIAIASPATPIPSASPIPTTLPAPTVTFPPSDD